MKKIIIIIEILALTLSISLTGSAQEEIGQTEQIIEDILSEYAEFREQQFFPEKLIEPDGLELSRSVYDDAIQRQRCLANNAERGGYRFIEVKSVFTITETGYTGNEVVVYCSEKSTIGYAYNGDVATDEMQVGTEHTIYISLSTDVPIIEADTHDEWAYNGFISSDYEITDDTVLVRSGEDSLDEGDGRSYSSYSATTAVSYALANANMPGDYAMDCCNFVSKCLNAGGVVQTSQWAPGTSAWIYCADANSYWVSSGPGLGVARYGANDYSHCGIGNPIYYLTGVSSPSGHFTICVGFNSAGIPIYAAHSPAVSGGPITDLLSNGYSTTLFTLEFAHRYTYQDVNNLNYHKRTCTICNSIAYVSHNWVPISLNYCEDPVRYIPAWQCYQCGAIKYGP